MAGADFLSILRVLQEHAVDFIVVGGVGAVLHGAPVSTFDLDVVHSTEPGNVQRLLPALEVLDAHLASTGHQLLITKFGPLDLLGQVGPSYSYSDLLTHAQVIEAGDGARVQVLDLETIIALKEETAGAKDLATLPVLRETLRQKRRQV